MRFGGGRVDTLQRGRRKGLALLRIGGGRDRLHFVGIVQDRIKVADWRREDRLNYSGTTLAR